MKKISALFSLLLFNSVFFAQTHSVSFQNEFGFTGGTYQSNGYDRTIYLNQGETIEINSFFGDNNLFTVHKADYSSGVLPQQIMSNTSAYNYSLWCNFLPCQYDYQNNFGDFVFFIRYYVYYNLNETYKVLVINNSSASIEESLIEKTKVFPNPATEFLTIEAPEYEGMIEIVDLAGRVLIQTTDKQIDVRDLAPGQYILKYASHSERFIVN